jgi:hypothetical protein
MKKTWVAGLVLLGMASLRLSAGEVGIFADKLIGTTQAVNTGVQLGGQPLTAGSFNSISPTGYGVRLGYSLLNLEVLDIGVVGTYHPSVQGNVVLAGQTLGVLQQKYAAVGIQADWTFLLNLHAGVEYRAEKLNFEGDAPFTSQTVNYYRPWMNAGIGLSLPLPVVKPFVRLEVAVPVNKTATTVTSSSTDLIKAMAPTVQVSLYGGIRF